MAEERKRKEKAQGQLEGRAHAAHAASRVPQVASTSPVPSSPQ